MWLWLVVGTVVGYLLLLLVRLLRADGDLQALGRSLKSDYFKDRVVWVTGVSSGIGEEMCYQLSRLRARVILTARNEEKLKEMKSQLSNPDNGRVLPVDLSDPEATRASVDKAVKLFGKVDMLVNNAGVSTRALFQDLHEEVHRKVMEIDFFAPWILTHRLLEDAKMQGTNVHVTNVAPGPVVMGAGVNALRGDGVSDKMQGTRVHVTNVAPGPVVTGAG